MSSSKSARIEEVIPGCQLEVKLPDSDEWNLADVINTKESEGKTMFYVHYIGLNRRLDDWVTEDYLNTKHVKFPRRNEKQKRLETPSKKTAIPKPIQSAAASSTSETTARGSFNTSPKKFNGELNRTAVNDVKTDNVVIAVMKNVQMIELGRHRIKPWYFSPYPQDLCRSSCIYICEFCLKYFPSSESLQKHLEKCNLKHPDGREIYRKDDLSFFEVDGKVQEPYAERLCLLSKLFLDHKTLEFDIKPFTFYVLTESTSRGFHIVGYFSKDKENDFGYNLSCILTLPPYQKKGYGRLLIEFSYLLSKCEKKIGRPEEPLSDLGWLSYTSYWSQEIIEILIKCETMDAKREISLKTISEMTGIHMDNINQTLAVYNLVVQKNGRYCFHVNKKNRDRYQTHLSKYTRRIDPKCLIESIHQEYCDWLSFKKTFEEMCLKLGGKS